MKEQLLQLIALLRDDVLTNAKTDGTTQLQCSYLYDITGKMADLLTKPDFKKENQKISIPLSDNDLEDLQGGETFDWTFDGVDVHLYQTNEDIE